MGNHPLFLDAVQTQNNQYTFKKTHFSHCLDWNSLGSILTRASKI